MHLKFLHSHQILMTKDLMCFWCKSAATKVYSEIKQKIHLVRYMWKIWFFKGWLNIFDCGYCKHAAQKESLKLMGAFQLKYIYMYKCTVHSLETMMMVRSNGEGCWRPLWGRMFPAESSTLEHKIKSGQLTQQIYSLNYDKGLADVPWKVNL